MPLSLWILDALILLLIFGSGYAIVRVIRRRNERQQQLLSSLAKVFHSLEAQEGKTKIRFWKGLRQNWYLRGKIRNKRFEIFSQSERSGSVNSQRVAIRLLEPELPKSELKFELRPRKRSFSLVSLLGKPLIPLENSLIDRRVVFSCNDGIFARQFREYEELMEALLQAFCLGSHHGILWFRKGQLCYTERAHLKDQNDVERLDSILLLCADLADLIVARSWSNCRTTLDKSMQTSDKNHHTQRH